MPKYLPKYLLDMNNQNVSETDVKLLMGSLLQDLGKLGGANPHPKWVESKDERTGLLVGEYQ
jgi:hypothetical protein